MTDSTQTPAERALAHLQAILQAAALDAQAVLTEEAEQGAILTVTGPDAALLVGPQGQTLDALQYLLMAMVNKGQGQRLRITVDADSYRARRAQKLTNFAGDLAAQVMESGEEAVTDPLNAMERRIVHTALVNHPAVRTYSEGDEPGRYVVISPRGDDDPA